MDYTWNFYISDDDIHDNINYTIFIPRRNYIRYNERNVSLAARAVVENSRRDDTGSNPVHFFLYFSPQLKIA